MLGTLATFGYGGKHSIPLEEELDSILIANTSSLIIDTRFTPWCNWSPIWCKNRMQERWGKRYIAAGPLLGNLNHHQPDKGIQLANEAEGIPWLVRQIEQGKTLLILCGCANFLHCHRRYIFHKVVDHFGDQLHFFEAGQVVLTPQGLGTVHPDIPTEIHQARNRYTVLLSTSPKCTGYYFPSELQSYGFNQLQFLAS